MIDFVTNSTKKFRNLEFRITTLLFSIILNVLKFLSVYEKTESYYDVCEYYRKEKFLKNFFFKKKKERKSCLSVNFVINLIKNVSSILFGILEKYSFWEDIMYKKFVSAIFFDVCWDNEISRLGFFIRSLLEILLQILWFMLLLISDQWCQFLDSVGSHISKALFSVTQNDRFPFFNKVQQKRRSKTFSLLKNIPKQFKNYMKI